jgi:hypothetical protein
MSLDLLRSLVWTDYRLAVLFCVLCPLALMVWAIRKNAKPITHLLIIYWRVSSLLAISVYLLLDQNRVGFMVGFAALILIPLSLWFWVDINEEIEDRRGLLKIAVDTWRWATTIYCAVAALGQISYLKCASSAAILATPECQVWLEPAKVYGNFFHAGTRTGRLGFTAIAALVLYSLYFGYFIIFRFTKQGRMATKF